MKGFKDSVSVSTPSNSRHNLSHVVNTTADLFQFRPVFCEEMYPSDHFEVNVSDYFRAEPLAGPSYGVFRKKYSAFFVPYRILWDKWDDFLTGGSNGRLEFNVPYVTLEDFYEIFTATNDVLDDNIRAIQRHMCDMWSDLGVPIDWLFSELTPKGLINEFKIPLFRFMAIRHIWFDWFRDQNLIGDDLRETYCSTSFPSSGYYNAAVDLQSYENFTPSANNLLGPYPLAIEKDYFTTAMLEPQRGGAAFVPVKLPSADLNPSLDFGSSSQLTNGTLKLNRPSTSVLSPSGVFNDSGSVTGATDIIGMFDYNLVRSAKALQKYLEKNNISGGADLQQLLAHWGTAPNPAVFQRSTYIGSFSSSFTPTEVVSPMDSEDSVAGQVSTKVNANGNGSFEYTANEHGFFIIIQTIRPENTYVGGIRREVLHGVLGNGRFDFGTPEMEPTGFQPQYNYELTSMVFLDQNRDANPNTVRGYVPRYAELKRAYNRFTGQMSTELYKRNRVAIDYGRFVQIDDQDIAQSTAFTMVYGYPSQYPFDLIFKVENPLFDHFQGWIRFDWKADRPFHEYSAPLIEDAKGNDITLPYAGVRM